MSLYKQSYQPANINSRLFGSLQSVPPVNQSLLNAIALLTSTLLEYLSNLPSSPESHLNIHRFAVNILYYPENFTIKMHSSRYMGILERTKYPAQYVCSETDSLTEAWHLFGELRRKCC